MSFAGSRSVTIPSGSLVRSDALRFSIVPFRHLAVSFHIVGGPVALDMHPEADQNSFLTGPGSGAHSGDVSGAAFSQTTTSEYAVDELDVLASGPVTTVATLGDSITDGTQSTHGRDTRWPDDLQRRLLASHLRMSVLGRSGDRMTRTGAWLTDPPGRVVVHDVNVVRRRPLAALLSILAVFAGTPIAAEGASRTGWITTWSVAEFRLGPLAPILNPTDFNDAAGVTVRNIVRTSIGSRIIRVRLSNLYGTRSVTFDHVRVALAAHGAATVAGSTRTVLFNGSARVTIPVGAQVRSDPVALRVQARHDVSVSLYSSRPTGRVTIGGDLLHPTYLAAAADYTTNAGGAPFTSRVSAWYFLSGIDVRAGSTVGGAIVALGDSITAGTASTASTWRAWVDRSAGVLSSVRNPLALLNAGISGNTLHEDSPCFGQRGSARLSRDVFAQSGVRAVILALGVNDLLQPNESHQGSLGSCNAKTRISASRMIALYRQVANQVHQRGLKIIGATITPFGANPASSPALEAERQALNDWILHKSPFDAVINFSKVLADPADPARLAARFDSGDGLHPNDAGHAAMARVVPTAVPSEQSHVLGEDRPRSARRSRGMRIALDLYTAVGGRSGKLLGLGESPAASLLWNALWTQLWTTSP